MYDLLIAFYKSRISLLYINCDWNASKKLKPRGPHCTDLERAGKASISSPRTKQTLDQLPAVAVRRHKRRGVVGRHSTVRTPIRAGGGRSGRKVVRRDNYLANQRLPAPVALPFPRRDMTFLFGWSLASRGPWRAWLQQREKRAIMRCEMKPILIRCEARRTCYSYPTLRIAIPRYVSMRAVWDGWISMSDLL